MMALTLLMVLVLDAAVPFQVAPEDHLSPGEFHLSGAAKVLFVQGWD